MNYSEGKTKILTFGLLAITVFIGVYAYGKNQRSIQQTNHVALCVGSYTGNDETGRDWPSLLRVGSAEAAKQTGINQAIIEDCTRP